MTSPPAQPRARGGGRTRPIRELARIMRDGRRLPWRAALPLIVTLSALLWAGIIYGLILIF